MSEHLRSRALHRSAIVRIDEIVCNAHRGPCGAEEYNASDAIVFPRRGLFVKHIGSRRVVVDPSQVVFFGRGQSYRVSHPLDGGDTCVSLRFAGEVLRAVMREHDPAASDRERTMFSSDGVRMNAAALLACFSVLRDASCGEELAVDEAALAALRAVVRRVCVEDRRRARLARADGRRSSTQRAHREQVAAVQEYLAQTFPQMPSLTEIARTVHCAAPHLTRIFRQQTGMPLYQYATRLRLAAALDRLADGAGDLTRLALDLGFSSHSHFANAFRVCFGAAPSHWRPTRARLREMRKNLQV